MLKLIKYSSFRNIVRVSNSLDQDQARHFDIFSGGGTSKNKVKNIFPMTNITILGVFGLHVQKDNFKVLEMKSIYIRNILALLLFLKLAMRLLTVWSKRHPV